MDIPIRYAPISFAHKRRKNPITIPGEKIMFPCDNIELSPECEKAENGSNEKGTAV
jgi:hypothetical protein